MLMQTVGLIFISCVLLGISMSFLFTNAVRKPIDRLVNHVGRIAKGDFSQEESLESQDEIGLIGKAVNSMSSQIEQLMDKRLEDEKEKAVWKSGCCRRRSIRISSTTPWIRSNGLP